MHMGLRSSRILQDVHPWLRVRLEWLGEVARIIGSGQTLISGNRDTAQQRKLFEGAGTRPVAAPGCSQHQYGFAADATYLPSFFVTSKGRPMTNPQIETNEFMKNAAHHVSLTTVAGDPGHVQIYPGNQFRNWAVGRGFCKPIPPPRAPILPPPSFIHPDGQVVTRPDGSKTWVWHTAR